MEGEINNYIKIWLQVIISLFYCYASGKSVPKGFPMLLAILPILCLFLALPLALHSVHLAGTFAFSISWLANFKLLLFAFGKGPLSDPSFSLKQFLAVASFPIKSHDKNSHPNPKFRNGTTSFEKSPMKATFDYIIIVLLFGVVLKFSVYKDYMHPMVLLRFYCVHIYLSLEIILGIVAALARTLLGVELEPQFNDPYLASSLQDFWGRRWNLVPTKILRPTVYEPTRRVVLPLVGPKLATLSAIFVTFLVSGLIHELIFYYLGRVRPTWEITGFFILHGSCLLLELSLKKKLTAKFRLPRIVSGPLNIGFPMVTAFWLFFPQLLRCNGYQRAIQEYAAVSGFVKNATRTSMLVFNNAFSFSNSKS